jgi:hypothetical protein
VIGPFLQLPRPCTCSRIHCWCRKPKDAASSGTVASDVSQLRHSQCIVLDDQAVACSGACVGLWRGGKSGKHAAVISLLQRPLQMLVRAEALVAAEEGERSVQPPSRVASHE